VAHGSQDHLPELVVSLSAEQKRAVEAFIRYLREKDLERVADVRAAIDEFVRDHSELLRRLAH
jgi:hypothetical protein